MREGRSDEDILALTGVSLLRLIEIRMEAAMEPGPHGWREPDPDAPRAGL
jgi:hypothetical protein